MKNERTLLVSSFEPTLELTLEPELDLEPPLRLDDGLFSFSSAFCSCLDFDFDLDLDFERDLDGPLLPLVYPDPDFKLRLAVLATSISIPPSNPTRHRHL